MFRPGNRAAQQQPQIRKRQGDDVYSDGVSLAARPRQLVQQQTVVNGGILAFDIGPRHESVFGQARPDLPHRRLGAAPCPLTWVQRG